MHNVGKKFPGVNAQKDMNFHLSAGQIHVLLGENGAAKSTLIKIISGAISKRSGMIIFGNEAIDIQNPRPALDLGIATIYQEFNLIPQLTVAENIFRGPEPINKSGIINYKQMTASVAQHPYEMGFVAVPKAIEIIHGDELKKEIPITIELITREKS